MIDSIKSLINKTNELDEKYNRLSSYENVKSNMNHFVCFSSTNLNQSFINQDKILLAEFEITENQSLYFQNKIDINLPIDESVKFSLFINNIAIYRSTKNLNAGFNQITIMKSYLPLKSEQVNLYLKIETNENSLITILSNDLLIWGLDNVSNEISYISIEINDSYFLSYLNNNSIYYKIVGKEPISLNSVDFDFYSYAKAFSVSYLNNSNTLFLFKIDLDGNLQLNDFYNNKIIYLDSFVTDISSTTDDEKFVISYIKNNKCFNMEIYPDYSFSNPIPVLFNVGIPKKSYINYNKFNNKFYLVICNQNGSNFLIKNCIEHNNNHFNISANYSIKINTYEVTKWNWIITIKLKSTPKRIIMYFITIC